MEKKVCFLIPVYPNDYSFLDFLNTLPDTIDFDIIFIISYKDDYALLESLNYKKVYKVLILENYLEKEYIAKIIEDRNIVTFKKYFALNKYRNTYKYLATVDSEIQFVNVENIYEKFDQYFTNRKIYGGIAQLEFIYDVNSKSASLFNNTEQKAIQEATHNYSLYFWFSDIPIYESDTLCNFLNHISFAEDSTFTSKLEFCIFDYIPYIYYLHLYDNWQFININEHNITRTWSLEIMPITTYNKVVETFNYKPMWVIPSTYNQITDPVSSNIIMLYHRDRTNAKYINFND